MSKQKMIVPLLHNSVSFGRQRDFFNLGSLQWFVFTNIKVGHQMPHLPVYNAECTPSYWDPM